MIKFVWKKGGWNSKRMWTHLGDGASHMSPLTPSPTSRYSRFLIHSLFEISSRKSAFMFFCFRSNWSKVLFSWMLLAKPSMRSWVKILMTNLKYWDRHIFQDEVLATKAGDHLNVKQREGIHHLFTQGVKHKMRMNILRQVSKTSEFQVGRMTSREGEDPIEEDENEGGPTVRKISTASIFNMVGKPSQLLLILLSPVT